MVFTTELDASRHTQGAFQCKAAGGMSGEAPKSRDELLVTAIGELKECWIGVRCTNQCNRSSYLPLKLMAAQRGRRERLRAIVAKLRCECCKTPPSAIWIVDYPVEDANYGGQAASWRVELTP